MYILGHYMTALMSGRFSLDVLTGEHGAALYFPDFVRCHDWGYARCFHAPGHGTDSALIQAHMLGDWLVHYGPGNAPKRRGWAYRRMNVFAREYEHFFDTAARLSLLCSPEQDRDSVRGFSHSMVEYCIDTHLSYLIDDSSFIALRRVASEVGSPNGSWSEDHVRDTIAQNSITGSFVELSDNLQSFSSRAAASAGPAEFAYRAGVKKFKLRECAESIGLIARTIEAGLREIPGPEIDEVVAITAAFIARHVGHRQKEDAWTC